MNPTIPTVTRRKALALMAWSLPTLPMLGCQRSDQTASGEGRAPAEVVTSKKQHETPDGATMQVHYLEIVTRDVEATCQLYAGVHGVTFADADQSLGGARVAQLTTGGMLGVRAPMHAGENPVTRAYMLVEDIEASVAAAQAAGAEIAVPPMKLSGHGTCAIYIHGGIEAGLWQL